MPTVLHFPDLAILRLALAGGHLARPARLPARVAQEGPAWRFATTERPAAAALDALARLGVSVAEGDLHDAAREVSHWLEAVPAEPVRGDWAPAEVLFDLPDGRALVVVSAELRRLGARNQEFAWGEHGRVWLYAERPSLFALLRDPEMPVYRRVRPAVWSRHGWVHPLAEFAPAPRGVQWLIDPDGWRQLPAVAFQRLDLPTRDFALPPQPSPTERLARQRVGVRPRLTRDRAGTPAALWRLPDGACSLIELATSADDEELARYDVALLADGAAVLRARPGKAGPPVPGVSAEGYAPFWKLPNLFVPSGYRLVPPLRRDVVRNLFAPDADVFVWLRPGGDGPFTPESVPATAFRPLSGCVEYLLTRAVVPAEPWRPAGGWEPEPFTVAEPVRAGPATNDVHFEEGETIELPAPPTPTVTVVRGVVPTEEPEVGPVPELPAWERSTPTAPEEFRQQLAATEEAFRALALPADAPDRAELWVRMGGLNAVLGHEADAALCWCQAIWERESVPAGWLAQWRRGVAGLEALLAEPATAARMRGVAECVVLGTFGPRPDPAVGARAAELARLLERYDEMLPARLAWLAWEGLARGDVLGLTRAADRLLGRLAGSGLRADVDVPSFLRGGGQIKPGGIGPDEFDRLWRASATSPPFADHLYAFALARMGETTRAAALAGGLRSGLPPLAPPRDPPPPPRPKRTRQRNWWEAAPAPPPPPRAVTYDAGTWLGLAFLERIAQALEGRSASGPLPDVLRLHLTAADPLTRSAINRYRGASRVLEPFERFDAFGWNQQSLRADDLPALAAAALGLGEPAAVIARFTELLEMHPSPGSQTALVSAALTAAPRLGEGFAVDLLKRATRAALQCRPDEELYRVVGMLEGALSTAGYFGRDDAVPDLVRALTDVFAYTDPVRVGWLVAQADVQGFRVLARLGRAEDVGRLIRATATNILRAQDLPGAREAWGSNWPVVLPGLLYVAGGWFYLGESEAASEVLEEARTLLLRRTLSTQGQARLTAAYARALGQAPPEVALPRMGELLTRLDRLTPEGGPGWGWSEQMVEWRVLESVVLAAVSDDFTAGTEVRRWLDEDEYLVRRRVHRSVRRALASG